MYCTQQQARENHSVVSVGGQITFSHLEGERGITKMKPENVEVFQKIDGGGAKKSRSTIGR